MLRGVKNTMYIQTQDANKNAREIEYSTVMQTLQVGAQRNRRCLIFLVLCFVDVDKHVTPRMCPEELQLLGGVHEDVVERKPAQETVCVQNEASSSRKFCVNKV